MECAVITTYRCNARCQMCNTWKNPSRIDEEITPEIIDRIPSGHKRLNITGGEPLLRRDVFDIISSFIIPIHHEKIGQRLHIFIKISAAVTFCRDKTHHGIVHGVKVKKGHYCF